MASVRALIHDLQRKGANPALTSSLEKVLANEAQPQIKEVEVDG